MGMPGGMEWILIALVVLLLFGGKKIPELAGGVGIGAFTDPRDGQDYITAYIGNQKWLAENLNYETTNSWWFINSTANGEIYGRLYTWEAALIACPNGWHLPSDNEWKTFEMALGMSQSEANNTGWRGTNEGGKMKETGTTHWSSPNTGASNTVGFTALPGGIRTSDGSFFELGNYGDWWSTTEESGTLAWSRYLYSNSDQVNRHNSTKTTSFSVRCLKD
jgi:TatA/E family protein of Tat protein translocase|tara:strand:+ start:2702 stop:3361 length:660 start_codon:yes stop_codon:yes gene_type:complete